MDTTISISAPRAKKLPALTKEEKVGDAVTRTERDLKRVFPRERWNRLHLQIIFFGREHCPARGPDLSQCPICSWAATAKRIAEEAKKNAPGARARSQA